MIGFLLFASVVSAFITNVIATEENDEIIENRSTSINIKDIIQENFFGEKTEEMKAKFDALKKFLKLYAVDLDAVAAEKIGDEVDVKIQNVINSEVARRTKIKKSSSSGGDTGGSDTKTSQQQIGLVCCSHNHTKLLEEYEKLTAVGFKPKTVIDLNSPTDIQIKQLDKELKAFKEEILPRYKELWRVAQEYGLNPSTEDPFKIYDNFYNALRSAINRAVQNFKDTIKDKDILSTLFPDKKYTSFEQVTQEDINEISEKCRKFKIVDKLVKKMSGGKSSLKTTSGDKIGDLLTSLIQRFANFKSSGNSDDELDNSSTDLTQDEDYKNLLGAGFTFKTVFNKGVNQAEQKEVKVFKQEVEGIYKDIHAKYDVLRKFLDDNLSLDLNAAQVKGLDKLLGKELKEKLDRAEAEAAKKYSGGGNTGDTKTSQQQIGLVCCSHVTDQYEIIRRI